MQLGLIVSDEWTIGKHKGTPIKELPTEYLTWVVYDSEIGGMHLKKALAELDRREENLKGNLGEALDDNIGFHYKKNEW